MSKKEIVKSLKAVSKSAFGDDMYELMRQINKNALKIAQICLSNGDFPTFKLVKHYFDKNSVYNQLSKNEIKRFYERTKEIYQDLQSCNDYKKLDKRDLEILRKRKQNYSVGDDEYYCNKCNKTHSNKYYKHKKYEKKTPKLLNKVNLGEYEGIRKKIEKKENSDLIFDNPKFDENSNLIGNIPIMEINKVRKLDDDLDKKDSWKIDLLNVKQVKKIQKFKKLFPNVLELKVFRLNKNFKLKGKYGDFKETRIFHTSSRAKELNDQEFSKELWRLKARQIKDYKKSRLVFSKINAIMDTRTNKDKISLINSIYDIIYQRMGFSRKESYSNGDFGGVVERKIILKRPRLFDLDNMKISHFKGSKFIEKKDLRKEIKIMEENLKNEKEIYERVKGNTRNYLNCYFELWNRSSYRIDNLEENIQKRKKDLKNLDDSSLVNLIKEYYKTNYEYCLNILSGINYDDMKDQNFENKIGDFNWNRIKRNEFIRFKSYKSYSKDTDHYRTSYMYANPYKYQARSFHSFIKFFWGLLKTNRGKIKKLKSQKKIFKILKKKIHRGYNYPLKKNAVLRRWLLEVWRNCWYCIRNIPIYI